MKASIIFVLAAAALLPIVANSQSIYSGIDIRIDSGAYLYISGDFTTVSSASFTNNGTLEVKGNILSDINEMTQGNGLTKLTGNSFQRIGGTQPFVVNDITFDNSASVDSNIVLDNQLIIGGIATFVNGIVKTNNNKVTFNSGASSTGSSNVSYINGFSEKKGNTPFTFLVGDSVKLRTASLNAPATTNDAFTCKYIHSSPIALCGLLAEGSGIHHISSNEYWVIERTSGTSNPIVTLSYDDSYSGNISSFSELKVAFLDTVINRWVNLGGIVSGDNSIGDILAESSPGKFGVFTIGSSSNMNPLPIELVSFKAGYNKFLKTVDLTWFTLSENNTNRFVVERSEDGIAWESISNLKAAGNSTEKKSYSTVDLNPLKGYNYYRLRETDNDESYVYSSVQFVDIQLNSERFTIYPNPTTGNSIIVFHSAIQEYYTVEISNESGQIIYTESMQLGQGEHQLPMSTFGLHPGNYSVKFYSLNSSEIHVTKITRLN